MLRGHFICYGVVQGVFFRVSARDEALRLGLTGWVRNLPDGTVEAVAEGEKAAVDEFHRWCQHGPSYADVSRVDVAYSAALGEFDDFYVRY